MFTNQSSEISLNSPVPALESVKGDRGGGGGRSISNNNKSRFWAGTASLRSSEDSFVHLLSFSPDTDRFVVDTTLSHPTGPVSKIVSCPTDPSLLLSISENQQQQQDGGGNGNGCGSCTLWKVPTEVMDRADNSNILGDDDDDYDDYDPSTNVESMEKNAQLETDHKIADVSWRGGIDDEQHTGSSSSSFGDILTLSVDGMIAQWDVAFGSSEMTRSNTYCKSKAAEDPTSSCCMSWNLPPRMAWDPHHSDQVAVSVGSKVYIVDLRQDSNSSGVGIGAGDDMMMSSLTSSRGGGPNHRYGISDLDYNPNKPNVLTTSGKDGLVKFWDLRSARQPLLVAKGGHSHWANAVAYNPFHDQLILSAGSDSVVNLWRMSTISSAPLLTLDDDDGDGDIGVGRASNHGKHNMITTSTAGKPESDVQLPEGPNIRVSSQKHMDSVCAIAWGASDAFIFASACYDGKVTLSHVPSKEKYRILL